MFGIMVLTGLLLLALGIREKKINEKNRRKIKLRINVNGIRGKSTVTRLITGILNEAGYNTIGKTTGTEARMIYQYRENEIKRKPEGANIKEQIKVISAAKKRRADALVCECMAVRPEYQVVYSHDIINANVCVIVNVLEDHLDVMGPTTDQIAQAFGETIPYNGRLVITKDKYTEYFKKIAKKRRTKVFVADNDKIPQGYLEQFDYVLFPDNVSLALAVAESLEIPEEIALNGMLNAHPDPGALKITEIKNNKYNLDFCFVNAFAANEPSSSLAIIEKVAELGYNIEDMAVVFNGRPDRVDRTDQFIKDFFPQLPKSILIGMGQCISNIEKAYDNGKLNDVYKYINLENKSTDEIINEIVPYLNGRVLLGVGNIHGDGEDFIKEIYGLEDKLAKVDTTVVEHSMEMKESIA